MDELQKHEQFEIEVLNRLNSLKLLDPLVFGSGTMLRLCHELDRYSADLDFWFIKEIHTSEFFNECKNALSNYYSFTDAQDKFYSLLRELKSVDFPRCLKIEIRKAKFDWMWEESIAFSPHSHIQVLLNCHTLEQSMKNRIQALHDRNEIRNAYDIEFLIRKGITLPTLNSEFCAHLLNRLNGFSEIDFKVKLSSVIPADKRQYYKNNKFRLLKSKLRELLDEV